MTSDHSLVGTDLAAIDLETEAAFQCPYPLYDAFRSEQPIYYYERGGFYLVTRMAEVREALSKPNLFSSELRDLLGLGAELGQHAIPSPTLLLADPPEHGRSRNMINLAFSQPRVNAMEPRLRSMLAVLFDSFIDKGEFEAHRELAMPLPIDFIASQFDFLTDEPKERLRFWGWSEAIQAAFNPTLSTEEREKLAPFFKDMNDFFLSKRSEKIAAPTEDIISTIAAANPLTGKMPSEGSTPEDRLTDDEYLTAAQLLLVGGNENTTNAAMSGLACLASSPELFTRLRADRKLVRTFVEEVLRLETPATGFIRRVTGDAELGGVKLVEGDIVHLRFAAANRDPVQFPCPEKLDVERRNSTTHVAFGAGVHVCVGQMLARKELVCLFDMLLDRMTTLEVDPRNEEKYQHAFYNRKMLSLRLRFTKG